MNAKMISQLWSFSNPVLHTDPHVSLFPILLGSPALNVANPASLKDRPGNFKVYIIYEYEVF